MMKRRVLSVLLCAALLVGLLPAAAFAADTGDTFQYQFVAENGDTATKISHPAVAPNANGTDVRTNDGVVDYVGNGVLSDEIGSDSTSGARGESYSWSALGHGDWVYTCLLYNAMGNTIDQMKGSLGYEFDRDQMNAALNVLYNGDFYLGEEDEGNPGGALVKINVKTGEVKILMSKTAGEYRHSTLFRNAVEYNGKFYFCGSVDSAPQIWQVDPETDECKMVYGMSVQDFYATDYWTLRRRCHDRHPREDRRRLRFRLPLGIWHTVYAGADGGSHLQCSIRRTGGGTEHRGRIHGHSAFRPLAGGHGGPRRSHPDRSKRENAHLLRYCL